MLQPEAPLLTAAIGRLTYHSRRLERWIEGRPVILVEEGNLLEEAARAERISKQDLDTALRRHGFATAAAVRLAVLEPNGEITALPKAP